VIKTAQDVIAVAQKRGFKVEVRPGPPPMPVLVVPNGISRTLANEPLMAALRAWRLEIIDLVSKQEAP
jgi:hypothetical protein